MKREDIKRVYVAGPYRADNVRAIFANIRRGIEASKWILRAGYLPFCPWLDWVYLLSGDALSVDWIAVSDLQRCSLGWLRASDCVVLVGDWKKSAGVAEELAEASLLGIPALTFAEFRLWHADETGERPGGEDA